MSWQDEADVVQFSEPILPKKDCQVRIDFAESAIWKVKDAVPGHGGEEYKAAKLTITITDSNIQTEHEQGKARLTLEHQFNVEKYPYLSKKTGSIEWLSRQGVYELEEAFGFDPVYMNGDGQPVEAFVTKTGRKVPPKIDGVKRKINPAFATAYFTEDGLIKPDNWIDKTVYADIEIDHNEQFGDRNIIRRFKKAPAGL